MPDADLAREQRDQPAVFVPEEVLDQTRRGRRDQVSWRELTSQDRGISWISRTSTLEPGIITPGLSRATSSARSNVSADTSM